MGALVFAEIPDAHARAAIAGDELALVGVDDDVVDRAAMVVVALDGAEARVPNFDGAILGAGHHPFALAVECNSSDVSGVPFKGKDGAGVVGADVVEFDI